MAGVHLKNRQTSAGSLGTQEESGSEISVLGIQVGSEAGGAALGAGGQGTGFLSF